MSPIWTVNIADVNVVATKDYFYFEILDINYKVFVMIFLTALAFELNYFSIRTRKIDLRLNVLIFQRGPSFKMFLCCYGMESK